MTESNSVNFNPRAPCGARHITNWILNANARFQSTRPVWGATSGCHGPLLYAWDFNPRAPCGARQRRCKGRSTHGYFNPRAPCGARLCQKLLFVGRSDISIHAPRVGRDMLSSKTAVSQPISIHAPRVGRDSKFDDFTPSNLHKRYKRVLARPKNTREKGKIKQKLAYIHAFSAFLGCEGSGTFCALVLRTQYR